MGQTLSGLHFNFPRGTAPQFDSVPHSQAHKSISGEDDFKSKLFTNITKSKSIDKTIQRWSHASCQIGKRVFLFGGVGGVDHVRLNDMGVIDSESDSVWSVVVLKTMTSPTPRAGHTLTAINGMYVCMCVCIYMRL